MARTKRELWPNLVNPGFGGPVFPVQVYLDPADTNGEYPVFVATRNVAIRRAFVMGTADMGAATATLTLENVTDSEDLSATLDLSSGGVDLDGNDYAEFVLNANADLIEEGDILIVDYDSDTDIGDMVIGLEVEFLETKDT